MSHGLKSLDNSEGLAGVAERPQASNINGCDGSAGENNPAETAENPSECRTSRPDPDALSDANHKAQAAEILEIERRLSDALRRAGASALGMPGSVPTFSAWLNDAGLKLVLA